MIIETEHGILTTKPLLEVAPDGGYVRLDHNAPSLPGPPVRCWLSPEAARRLASALLDAADQVQGAAATASCTRCGAVKL